MYQVVFSYSDKPQDRQREKKMLIEMQWLSVKIINTVW